MKKSHAISACLAACAAAFVVGAVSYAGPQPAAAQDSVAPAGAGATSSVVIVIPAPPIKP